MSNQNISVDDLVDASTMATIMPHALGVKVAYADAKYEYNRLGKIYRDDAPLLMHNSLAEITVEAARDVHARFGWQLELLDSLRTVDAQYAMLKNPDNQKYVAMGMLSKPGEGAHPKGMAVDLMVRDKDGKIVDMGTPFDDFNAKLAHRNYMGDEISTDAVANRMLLEQSFQRAALKQGKLLAPLRNEWWDFRFPENNGDLWRVLESYARCLDDMDFVDNLERQRKENLQEFKNTWEAINYGEFLKVWAEFKQKHGAEKIALLLGTTELPREEPIACYHGHYTPLFDRDLRAANKHMAAENMDAVIALPGRAR